MSLYLEYIFAALLISLNISKFIVNKIRGIKVENSLSKMIFMKAKPTLRVRINPAIVNTLKENNKNLKGSKKTANRAVHEIFKRAKGKLSVLNRFKTKAKNMVVKKNSPSGDDLPIVPENTNLGSEIPRFKIPDITSQKMIRMKVGPKMHTQKEKSLA